MYLSVQSIVCNGLPLEDPPEASPSWIVELIPTWKITRKSERKLKRQLMACIGECVYTYMNIADIFQHFGSMINLVVATGAKPARHM